MNSSTLVLLCILAAIISLVLAELVRYRYPARRPRPGETWVRYESNLWRNLPYVVKVLSVEGGMVSFRFENSAYVDRMPVCRFARVYFPLRDPGQTRRNEHRALGRPTITHVTEQGGYTIMIEG